MPRIVTFLSTHLDVDNLLAISKPELIYPFAAGGWGIEVQLILKLQEKPVNYHLRLRSDELQFRQGQAYLATSDGGEIEYDHVGARRFSEDVESSLLIVSRMKSAVNELVKLWKNEGS